MNFAIKVFLFLAVPILCAGVAYKIISRSLLEALEPDSTEVKVIEIPKVDSFRAVTDILEQNGIVRFGRGLELLARLGKMPTTVNVGEYELSPSMTPQQVLEKVLSGQVVKRNLIIKPGVSVFEVGALLEEAKIMPKADFDPILSDKNSLLKAGITADSFEGYLYPESYDFARPISAAQVVWRMMEEGEKKWKQEYTDRAEELALSRHDILTIASLIQKESSVYDEQLKISSVFHNRFKAGMRLESEPSVAYGIQDLKGPLTKEDLLTDHAWNTFTRPGLPIGPICNPGESAIYAALYPEDTEYLFFADDGLGNHIFSTTLQEHNEAVNRLAANAAAAPGQ